MSLSFAASDSAGILIGAARLVPYIDVDTHYVTNPGRMATQTVSDLITVSRPGFKIRLDNETFKLNVGSDLEYQHYYGIQNPATRSFSTLAGQLNASADINRGSPLGIRVFESLTRSAQPGNETLTGRLLHTYNNLGIGIDYQPGGGALQLATDYIFFVDYYDRTNELGEGYNAAALDNMRHMPSMNLTWRFLPKTAAFLDAQGQLTDYFSSGIFSGTSIANPNSSILTTHMGLVGNLSSLVKVLLKAGYGASFISGDSSNQFSSAVGQLEIQYQLGPKDYLKVGFKRDLKPTSIFKYYGLMRGYLEYRRSFNHRWSVRAKLNYDDIRYGAAVVGPSEARVDGSIIGNIDVTYELLKWLDLSLVETFESRSGSYITEAGNGVSYFYNDINFMIRFKY